MSRKNKKDGFPDTTMTFGEHLEELRFRLIMAIIGLFVGMTICFIFGQGIISFIVAPYLKAVSHDPNPTSRLLILGPAEGFISYCNICMIAGLILASPWVFYHIWMFVAAGLYPHEKKYVYMTIPFSVALFIIGALFFMFFVALAYYQNSDKVQRRYSGRSVVVYLSAICVVCYNYDADVRPDIPDAPCDIVPESHRSHFP